MDEMILEPTKVYVKTNADGYIIDINSEIFLKDKTGWILIDQGNGCKYTRAQVEYFDKPLRNEDGTYNYKIGD